MTFQNGEKGTTWSDQNYTCLNLSRDGELPFRSTGEMVSSREAAAGFVGASET